MPELDIEHPLSVTNCTENDRRSTPGTEVGQWKRRRRMIVTRLDRRTEVCVTAARVWAWRGHSYTDRRAVTIVGRR
ncbi:hypothetical protein J6590_016368 [Homalodisca vitripennis]|nr:hypothetical protein J6590_016368 [Homalodisca vitripennis]